MRKTAFSTSTTNSRGVKSSLSRITFQSFGRSTFGLVLVRGVSTVCWLMTHLRRRAVYAPARRASAHQRAGRILSPASAETAIGDDAARRLALDHHGAVRAGAAREG